MDTPTLNPSPIKEGGTLTAQACPSFILGRGMGEMSSIFTTPYIQARVALRPCMASEMPIKTVLKAIIIVDMAFTSGVTVNLSNP